MRRVRLPLLTVLFVGALVASTGCGVTADTTAATVGDQTISVDSVNALARSAPIAADSGADDSESVVDGATARTALGLQVQVAAAVGEAERLGLQLDAAAGAAELDSQLQQAAEQGQSVPDLGDEAREAYTELFSAYLALSGYFASEDAASEAGLRRLYDGLSAYWDRICIAGLSAPAEQAERAAEVFTDDATVEQALSEIEGAEQIADPATDCVPRSALSADLLAAVDAVPQGTVAAGVVITGADGTQAVAFLRVEESRRLAFAEAQEELTALVEQLAQDPTQWVQLVAQEAEINPRYGSGVGQGASAGQLTVLAPPVPTQPADFPVTAPTPADTGATDTGQ